MQWNIELLCSVAGSNLEVCPPLVNLKKEKKPQVALKNMVANPLLLACLNFFGGGDKMLVWAP